MGALRPAPYVIRVAPASRGPTGRLASKPCTNRVAPASGGPPRKPPPNSLPSLQVARDLPALPIEFHPADRELAGLAADFKSRLRFRLADAFAAALPQSAIQCAGDPEFKAVEKGIKINWLVGEA